MKQTQLILDDETLKDCFYSKVIWLLPIEYKLYGQEWTLNNKVVMHKCDNGLCVNPNPIVWSVLTNRSYQ